MTATLDTSLETVEKQAAHDRSIIDHLIEAFSPRPRISETREPISVQSAAIYHQICRTQRSEWNYDLETLLRAE